MEPTTHRMERHTSASPIQFPFFLKLILNKKFLAGCCIFSIVALTLFGAFPAKAQTTTTILALDPANYVAQSVGESFTINLTVTNVTNLWQWCVGISWDPNVLNLTACHEPTDSLLKSVGSTFWLPVLVANGTINEMSSTSLVTPQIGANGTGVLATLTFTIMKETVASQITLFNTTLKNPQIGMSFYNPLIDHEVENATVTLRLGNAPVANAGQDQTVNQGTQVVLNGSQTSSSDPNATTYAWTFTDGTLKTLQGQVVNYTFNTPGMYNVTLFVQNSYGNSSDWTIVTVKDTTPPVAKISIQNFIPGQAIVAGQPVTFDSSQSTDLYSNIVLYTWDMGDNSPINSGMSPSVLHSYSNPGTYNVTLTVADAAGNNATATFTISVLPSNKNTSSTSLNLPTYLLGILSIVTILALGGSVFWLRKPRINNKANETTSPQSR